MTITLAKAKKAKESLRQKFNFSSSKQVQKPVVGMGIGKDGDDYHVQVYLEKKPTAAQKKNLPDTQDGVKVKYQVTEKFSLE